MYDFTTTATGTSVTITTSPTTDNADQGGSGFVFYGVTNQVTPEPSTIVLLATALVSVLAYAWRKRKVDL